VEVKRGGKPQKWDLDWSQLGIKLGGLKRTGNGAIHSRIGVKNTRCGCGQFSNAIKGKAGGGTESFFRKIKKTQQNNRRRKKEGGKKKKMPGKKPKDEQSIQGKKIRIDKAMRT